MKAVIFRETGEPKRVLELAEISTPPLAQGEALVRVLLSPNQRNRSAHGARALWLSAGVASQPGH